MKKVFVSLCMAATLMGMSSCASTKNVATLSSLGSGILLRLTEVQLCLLPIRSFPLLVLIQRPEKCMEIVVVTV